MWVIAAAGVGAVTGVVSLLLLIFGTGRKVGQLEQKLDGVSGKLIKETDWGELKNKVETLYGVYVIDALSEKNRNGDDARKGKGR